MADPTLADRTRVQPVPLFPEREWPGAHLPVPLTSFVGRGRETAAVAALLRRPGVRLVTPSGSRSGRSAYETSTWWAVLPYLGTGYTRAAMEVISGMTTDPKTMTVPPDSEIARVLQEAAETPLLVVARGAHYRVMRDLPDPFADYDPEGVLAALRQSAGAFAGLDADAFKAETRATRGQDSQGRPAS